MKIFIWCIGAVLCFSLLSVKPVHEAVPPKIVAPVAPPAQKNDGTTVLIKKKPTASKKGVRTFMHKVGLLESDGDYTAVNRFGMLGKYQFDPRTIRAMGFNVTKEEFLADPELQDKVMMVFMRDNKRSLRGVIRKFHGQEVNGVGVTESGVLAAAHLAGVGGVLSFFYPEKYQYKTSDKNGATVAMYMKKFANYDMRGL